MKAQVFRDTKFNFSIGKATARFKLLNLGALQALIIFVAPRYRHYCCFKTATNQIGKSLPHARKFRESIRREQSAAKLLRLDDVSTIRQVLTTWLRPQVSLRLEDISACQGWAVNRFRQKKCHGNR